MGNFSLFQLPKFEKIEVSIETGRGVLQLCAARGQHALCERRRVRHSPAESDHNPSGRGLAKIWRLLTKSCWRFYSIFIFHKNIRTLEKINQRIFLLRESAIKNGKKI